MLFQSPGIIQKAQMLVDGSFKFTVTTREFNPEEATALFELCNQEGWFLFSPNPITEKELPDEPAPEFKTDQSPSKRLRSCLFRYWEMNTNQSMPFDTFWKSWCDKKANEIKETLE